MRAQRCALSILIILSLLLTGTAPAAAGDFRDVAAGSALSRALDVLTALKSAAGAPLVAGFPDGTFHPEMTLTRAQGAKLAVFLLGLSQAAAAAGTASLFTDVPAGHWAVGYINVAQTQGVLRGYGDGRFGPDDPLTTDQWLTILVRVLGYSAPDLKQGRAQAVQLGLNGDIGAADGSAPLTRGNMALATRAAVNTRPSGATQTLAEAVFHYQGSLPAGWESYQDPIGFTLAHPRDWPVSSDPTSGRVRAQGPQGEGLVAWPFFVQGGLTAAAAGTVLDQLAGAAVPDARWNPPQAAGAAVQVMRGSAGGGVALAFLTWAPSQAGTAGIAYFLTAPSEETYRAAADTYTRILQSFRLAGAPVTATGGGTPAQSYVRWVDPAEKAFSVEVPQGWNASGGAVRPVPLLVQSEVDITSPDGAIEVWMGDHVNLFMEPNYLLQQVGIGVGGTYTDPQGYGYWVYPYLPGERFITDFALPQHDPPAKLVSSKGLPELARSLTSYGLNSYDAGEATYSFTWDGKDYTGAALVITERVQGSAGNNIWHVWRLIYYEAPADRAPEAQAAADHLAATFRIDPQWAQMQANLTADQSRIIADMGNSIRETISSEWSYRSGVMDEISRRRENATLGVVDVVDPQTGTAYKVESGSSYYWVDQRGTIIGTETSAQPDLDFRALLQLP